MPGTHRPPVTPHTYMSGSEMFLSSAPSAPVLTAHPVHPGAPPQQNLYQQHLPPLLHPFYTQYQYQPPVQPVMQPQPEPVQPQVPPQPEPVTQPQQEPVQPPLQPQPEPVTQPQPEPVMQPQPEPLTEPQPEPIQPVPIVEEDPAAVTEKEVLGRAAAGPAAAPMQGEEPDLGLATRAPHCLITMKTII